MSHGKWSQKGRRRGEVRKTTGCHKYGYSSKRLAEGIMRQRKRTAADDGDRFLHVYFCTDGCGLWHIGHKKGAHREP